MQSIIWSEKLKLFHWRPIVGLKRRRGHDKCNIVTRVGVHHLVCAKRPINPLDLVPRVLNHNRSRFRSLAIPHLYYYQTDPELACKHNDCYGDCCSGKMGGGVVGLLILSSSNLENKYYNEYVLNLVTFERHVQHGKCQERGE